MGRRDGPRFPKPSSAPATSYERDWLKRGFYVRWSDDTRSYVVQCMKCYAVTFSNDVKKIDRQVKRGCSSCVKGSPTNQDPRRFLPKKVKVNELDPTIESGAVGAYRDCLKSEYPSYSKDDLFRILRVEHTRSVGYPSTFRLRTIAYLIQTKRGWSTFDCSRVRWVGGSLCAACYAAARERRGLMLVKDCKKGAIVKATGEHALEAYPWAKKLKFRIDCVSRVERNRYPVCAYPIVRMGHPYKDMPCYFDRGELTLVRCAPTKKTTKKTTKKGKVRR